MEIFLLNLGISFTLSKLISYFLFIIIGSLLAFIFFKRSKNGRISKIPKLIISLILFITPFLVYFAIHPIYQGDFSNNSYSVKSKVDFPKNKQLIIIALVNCPYCVQSIETIKRLKKKNSAISIEYWVLSTDLKDKTMYQKLLGKTAKVKLKGRKANELAIIARGSYPTFVLSDKYKAIKAWNNDSFGVMAMDEACGGF